MTAGPIFRPPAPHNSTETRLLGSGRVEGTPPSRRAGRRRGNHILAESLVQNPANMENQACSRCGSQTGARTSRTEGERERSRPLLLGGRGGRGPRGRREPPVVPGFEGRRRGRENRTRGFSPRVSPLAPVRWDERSAGYVFRSVRWGLNPQHRGAETQRARSRDRQRGYSKPGTERKGSEDAELPRVSHQGRRIRSGRTHHESGP